MKITILNGSPRHNGNTQIMADTFSETARENGHTVNILNIANMNIRGCLGCKYCYSHGGKCVQDDDMENVLAELSDTDMVVFASPRNTFQFLITVNRLRNHVIPIICFQISYCL